MRGILFKAWRESRIAMLLFGIALFMVMMLLTFVLPQIQDELNTVWLQMPFMRTFVGALLGIDVENEFTAGMLQAIVWVHPVVLATLWAHEVILCTRLPAGEIDRGTADILLAWPVARRVIYVTESFVWLATGAIVLAFGLTGHLIGVQLMEEATRPSIATSLLVTFNLGCVYVAVGGVAYLISALSDRRGRAMATIVAIILASFLVNFLAQFWTPAEPFAFVSVLEYYKPAPILRDGRLPVGDVAVLLGVGAVSWVVGMEWFARRNIATT